MNNLSRPASFPTIHGISDEGIKNATFFFNELFGSLRKNTRKAYKCDFEKYARYMNEYRPGVPAFTADEDIMKDNIKTYVAYLLEQQTARTTISRNLNIISQVSNSMRIPNPYRDDRDFKAFIGNTISNGVRKAYRDQACPITVDMLQKISAKAPIDDLSLRNQTMANFAWDTLCRASEIAMAQWSHIDWNEGALFVPVSKSNKSGDPDYRFLSGTTLAGLSRLRDRTPVTAPFVFNPLRGVSTLVAASSNDDGAGLSYKAIIKGLRSAITFAGIGGANNYSGHSFRVGAALEMKRKNVADGLIQSAGGWKDGAMPNYYTRKLEAAESGAAVLAKILVR